MTENKFCAYYQARVHRPYSWYLVAILRSFEHLAFDRTLDKKENIFEFFIPQAREEMFVNFIKQMQEEGVVLDYKKLPNRLMDQHAHV